MVQRIVAPAAGSGGWAVRQALTAQPVSRSNNTTHRNCCCCFVNLNISPNQSRPFDGAIFPKKAGATTRNLPPRAFGGRIQKWSAPFRSGELVFAADLFTARARFAMGSFAKESCGGRQSAATARGPPRGRRAAGRGANGGIRGGTGSIR